MKPESVPAVVSTSQDKETLSGVEHDSDEDDTSSVSLDARDETCDEDPGKLFRRAVESVLAKSAVAKPVIVSIPPRAAASPKEVAKPAKGSRLELKEVHEV